MFNRRITLLAQAPKKKKGSLGSKVLETSRTSHREVPDGDRQGQSHRCGKVAGEESCHVHSTTVTDEHPKKKNCVLEATDMQ
jgi:hypothetical protein